MMAEEASVWEGQWQSSEGGSCAVPRGPRSVERVHEAWPLPQPRSVTLGIHVAE